MKSKRSLTFRSKINDPALVVGPIMSKSRILDSIWSGASGRILGLVGNSNNWYVMCQNYCYYMDSLQVSFLQVTASNIVQDPTLTAQPPFSTSAYWIMIYLISLVCDLNFPSNPESFHIKIPLQRLSNILDLLIIRPTHIKNKVSFVFLIKFCKTHFCHSGFLQPSEAVSASP